MGEEVRMTEYEVNDNGDDEMILDWEMGLPNGEDLTPLAQSLIPPELASAFSISPIPYRTLLDVNRASHTTISSIRGSHAHALSSTNGNNNNNSDNNNNIKSYAENRDPVVFETDEPEQNGSGSDSRKPDSTEEADSALRTDDNSNDDPSARTLKRQRLVWTPQLHKRFVDVVAHLGIKNAVPKTIMQLMNVEGLTRENVASHLQKYRLYLKRMQGLSNDDPSPSDHQLFASTPVPPQCLNYEGGNGGPHGGQVSNSNNGGNGNSNNSNNENGNNGHAGMAVYGAPAGMMPVPMYGMMNHQGFHHGHGFDPNMYNMNMNMNMGMGMNMSMGVNNMMHHQRDWSVNKHGHGSVASYPKSSDK